LLAMMRSGHKSWNTLHWNTPQATNLGFTHACFRTLGRTMPGFYSACLSMGPTSAEHPESRNAIWSWKVWMPNPRLLRNGGPHWCLHGIKSIVQRSKM
jgi:hypothetical protein